MRTSLVNRRWMVFGLAALLCPLAGALPAAGAAELQMIGSRAESNLDRQLAAALADAGFTGRVQGSLERRLGRPVDRRLAELGRALFFDSLLGLHDDNSCAGCHAPAAGFGDSQSIAIGIGNNGKVGPNRSGARNQRRSPMLVNTAFFPKLMWNGRFVALSGDPFDNSAGFQFPAPEGTTQFPAHDPEVATLLAAQGHIPPTELVEMAGFTGTAGSVGPRFDAFDDGLGATLPAADGSGFRNQPIRDTVLARLNASAEYRKRFGKVFPEVRGGGDIRFQMIGRALAELQISLTFADAPLDRFARGRRNAMTAAQKRGGVLFFGAAGCVSCHAVGGASNEMFSDFENHVLGVPQIAPAAFGVGEGNVVFDGPGEDEDFGAEQISGDPNDRYKFRTSPLRNVALQPTFFHNGAFTRLEDAIRHHLDVLASAGAYDPAAAGVDADLAVRRGPTQPVLDRLDPLVAQPTVLTPGQIADLVAFVGEALLDPKARPRELCKQVPKRLPSGRAVAVFEDCR
jgi:cytochrome c peroxidase